MKSWMLIVSILGGKGFTTWIDCCPANGNLLATCADDQDVKIYDRRESNIVKTFAKLHKGNQYPELILP